MASSLFIKEEIEEGMEISDLESIPDVDSDIEIDVKCDVGSDASEEDEDSSENEDMPASGNVPQRYKFSGANAGPHINLTAENSPGEYFKLFFTDELVEQITQETNRYATERLESKVLSPRSTWKSWIEVTIEEMHAFIGVIINMGIIHLPTVKMYWSMDWTVHTPFFEDVFHRDRFLQIFWMLHLSQMPPARGPLTTTKKIHNFLSYIDSKFREHYTPYQDISIHESRVESKGKISLKTCNPKKPTKSGTHVYSLTDSGTGYLCTFIPYYGKSSKDAFERPELPFSTIIALNLFSQLCENVQDVAGYHIYTDGVYTSVNLAEELAKLKCNITGTSMLNKPEAKKKEKLLLHKIIAYQCGDVTFLGWKDKRIVWMCSNWHNAETVEVKRRNELHGTEEIITKPRVIEDCTMNIGDVATADKYSGTYCFLKKTRKWWRQLFFWGLDASIVNAFHLHRLQTLKEDMIPLSHLQFRRELVYELVGSVRTMEDKRKCGRLSTLDHEERLKGEHFIYKSEYKKHKDCSVCSHRKVPGCRRQTAYYCNNCTRKPGLHPGICFERYHTEKKYKMYRYHKYSLC